MPPGADTNHGRPCDEGTRCYWRGGHQVRTLLRYLAHTREFCITYYQAVPEAEGFADSSFADDPVTRRSTTGFLLTLAGGAIAWRVIVPKVIALSTCEAEFLALAPCGQTVAWLRAILDATYPVSLHDRVTSHRSVGSALHQDPRQSSGSLHQAPLALHHPSSTTTSWLRGSVEGERLRGAQPDG